ncbi:hypothetical protein NXF25_002791 [Crotalus adamanteus]|uniref:P53 apoptosis effector related to PMP-22-like n=1 Tax=Crotalus adamanteus TaxID=8729 RepID=A0AAW1CAV8_CROAD
MVQYGLDYTRCRWILPLLLGLAMIFGIISLVGSGWVTSQSDPFGSKGSLWRLCSFEDDERSWGRGAAGTFLVGFVLVCICFALSIIAFAIPTLRFNFIRGIGGLCFVAAIFSLMGLVIYAVMISTRVVFPVNTVHVFDWSYGFGWTMCIMAIGLGFFFCCLPLYEDHILGNVKPEFY